MDVWKDGQLLVFDNTQPATAEHKAPAELQRAEKATKLPDCRDSIALLALGCSRPLTKA